jgi:hypothetical protein
MFFELDIEAEILSSLGACPLVGIGCSLEAVDEDAVGDTSIQASGIAAWQCSARLAFYAVLSFTDDRLAS